MQPNLQLLWIPSSTPMSSCPMLTYPGWILLCIHTCLCLWPYAFQLVQCTRYADSTDAFAFFGAKELDYFTNDISANPSNAHIPQRGLTQIETKQSTNIPSTLRVFRRSTLTQAMRLERSPVAKFSIENNQKGLRINSKFTSYPKFNGIMIMTILLADTPESDDTECSGASNQQPNKIHERKVEVKLINKPPRSSHYDSTRLHLQQSNFDVYMGAYEIPNNAITILFELKRMGLLHRAFFIGSMYQDTTKTMENSTKQPLFSWLDVLDADALARVDAVETLSVEYELWTHLYDLSDAPPHLQYASFNGCVPRSERRLSRDAESTCGDDFYTCDGEWFLCSTPHTDFVSIVFAESLQFESPGAYHQLRRQTFPWTVSLREKITSFESVGSVCTLRVGGTRTRNTASGVHATTATCPYISLLPVLLTFTIVLLDAESIQQPITFTVHMKYTNYAHVLDLVQIRIIPNAGGISPPIRGLSCNQEYPMICHFVYIHEWIMHEQDFENHDVLHGEMHIWGITYAKQFIRNVSAVLVPLTLHEYDGVVQRRMVLRDWNALIHSALSLPMGTMLRLVLPTFNTSFTTSKTSLRALLRTPHAQPDATGTTLESIVRRSTIMQNLRSTTATLTYASYLASIIPPCVRTGTVQSGSASGCMQHRRHDNDSTTMTPPHLRSLLIPALVGCISGALLVLCIVAVSHRRIHCARSFCMGNLHMGRCGSTLLVGDIIDCQALIRRGDSCSEMELESLGASDMNDFR